ncbi:hypothetical protein HCH_06508 [Hahella chejuensis KCTC 2396]|uniref:Uncharacterized protein n=1 Tax=Hahella chejuensis (strain KCTC 2396) TaxID=349521 RepID=Q2S875_HAHCH|nr:hypothetical protein [Hahella chejuensis]ABC33149.1 hypothetical protein HCH_06508 [Hahella chejuensis KCTC 2396]
METLNAVITIASVVLVLSGVVLFFGGKLANHGSEARQSGVYASFNTPTLVLLLAGVGIALTPRLTQNGQYGFNQLPAPAAGIENMSASSTQIADVAQSESQPQVSIQAKASILTAGGYELMSYSRDNKQMHLVGGMDLYALKADQYQIFVELNAYDDQGLRDIYTGSGLLYFDGANWMLEMEGGVGPAMLTQRETPVQLTKEGDFIVLAYEADGRSYHLIWLQD